MEEAWEAATADGTTLMHFDVRADNMILTERGLVLVDWPHAVVGPAWMDLLGLLPSAIMQGVADPELVWRRHPPARRADPDAVNAVLAAVAGHFVGSSLRPAPLNLPNVRAFQAAQDVAALSWLRNGSGEMPLTGAVTGERFPERGEPGRRVRRSAPGRTRHIGHIGGPARTM